MQFILDTAINITGIVSFLVGLLLYLTNNSLWVYAFGIELLILMGFSSLHYGFFKNPKNRLLGVLPGISVLLFAIFLLLLMLSQIGLVEIAFVGCILLILGQINNFQNYLEYKEKVKRKEN